MLYRLALPAVTRFVQSRLGKPDLVDDVVQEIFLTMVMEIGDLRATYEKGFYAWLMSITRAQVSLRIKKISRTDARHLPLTGLTDDEEGWDEREPPATDLESDPQAMQEWREQVSEINKALEGLTNEQRSVIKGRFIEGKEIEELSLTMDKRPGAIRQLQFRALKQLAKSLGRIRGPQAGRQGGQG